LKRLKRIKRTFTRLLLKYGHFVISIGIVLSYLPIIYSEDINMIRLCSAIVLFLFLLYMNIPVSKYQLKWEKYKTFLKNERYKDETLKYLVDEMLNIEVDDL